MLYSKNIHDGRTITLGLVDFLKHAILNEGVRIVTASLGLVDFLKHAILRELVKTGC